MQIAACPGNYLKVLVSIVDPILEWNLTVLPPVIVKNPFPDFGLSQVQAGFEGNLTLWKSP